MNKKEKPFSNPRWSQDPGLVPTGKKRELTEEEKKLAEELGKEWQVELEELKKKKEKNKNTQ